MKWAAPIELFLKIAIAFWMFHIIYPSQKEIQIHQHLADGKRTEEAIA